MVYKIAISDFKGGLRGVGFAFLTLAVALF